MSNQQEKVYGRGDIIIPQGGGARLEIKCHDMVYQFSLNLFGDGAIGLCREYGQLFHFVNNVWDIDNPIIGETCRRSDPVQNAVIRPHVAVVAHDGALTGDVCVLFEGVEAVDANVRLVYSFRWSPYVALDVERSAKILQAHFRTRARLLTQLGEQLIKNEGVALLELIKNAYDADATMCDVVLRNPQDLEHGTIEILDDGCGMTPRLVTDVWLEIGTDYKERMSADSQTCKTARFGRMRLGEKGIGRLGVHRLGQHIQLITKSKEADKEVCLTIDWRQMEAANFVENIPLVCEEREPEVFVNGQTGTKIVISGFRAPWTKRMAVEAARTIGALNSPFDSDDSFNAIFKVEGDADEKHWIESVPDFDAVKDNALFSFAMQVSGDRIMSFTYDFNPWPELKLATPRHVTWGRSGPLSLMVYPKGVYDQWDEVLFEDSKAGTPIDISEIGTISFSGVVFDLDANLLTYGMVDKRALKMYLRRNCGVKVFRNNMRVLDYGEPGNDWLGLNARKLGKSSAHVSNSVIVAAVNLSGDSRRALPEKANREGFIEGDSFNRLKAALTFCMERLDLEWRRDKELLKRLYDSGEADADVPVKTPLAELRILVEQSKLDVETRERLMRCIGRVEKDYDDMTNNLIKSAGAGLSLVMVIHQIEKVIAEAQSVIRQNGDLSVVSGLIKDLEDLVGGYSIILKKSDAKFQPVRLVLEQSVFNIGFRLRAHKIALVKGYDEKTALRGYYARGHMVNAIINLFDNAIWWLGYLSIPNAQLYVGLSEKLPGYVTIVVADNGRGFTIPRSELDKPFVSAKPGGMGIGLHLTSEIMRSLRGKLLFPSRDEFDVPDQFSGAIVALALKKEELA